MPEMKLPSVLGGTRPRFPSILILVANPKIIVRTGPINVQLECGHDSLPFHRELMPSSPGNSSKSAMQTLANSSKKFREPLVAGTKACLSLS
jgi:hypothetical protein